MRVSSYRPCSTHLAQAPPNHLEFEEVCSTQELTEVSVPNTKLPELKFHALLSAGVREVRFERATMS
jgi:hypothetical protein